MQISVETSQNPPSKYLARQKCTLLMLIKFVFDTCNCLKICVSLSVLNSLIAQVNAGVKVKVRGSYAPPASTGTRSCVGVFALHSVPGTSPSTPTPACVSAERVHIRVCCRAGSSTPTSAGRCTRGRRVCP